MGASNASVHFLSLAIQFAEDHALLDQDAIQAVLTGHTQVNRPSGPLWLPQVYAFCWEALPPRKCMQTVR